MTPLRRSLIIGCSPTWAATPPNFSSPSSPQVRMPRICTTSPVESSAPATLLGWLQADVAENRAPLPQHELPVLEPADRSVQFHACHGPDRQVEVLREVLVGLLADDPTLEPRDIVVMCPDIEKFAPLIAASFGLDTPETPAEHPGHRLRVRLADRSLRQVNPCSRSSAGSSHSPTHAWRPARCWTCAPLRRWRGNSASASDDLERLHDLVLRAGVRWGFDAAASPSV